MNINKNILPKTRSIRHKNLERLDYLNGFSQLNKLVGGE